MTLTAEATGDTPMSWAWKQGATEVSTGSGLTATYTKSNATTADAGDYTCTFTNDEGSDTSDAATVTISTAPIAPTVSVQPTDTTVTEGQPFTLTSEATGSTPMQWVWKKGGSEVSGSSGTGLTATLTKNVAQLAHNGSYTCEFTNEAGTAISDEATVTVNAAAVAPEVTTHPSDLTVTVGEPISLVAVATGSEPMQWSFKKGADEVATGTGLSASFDKAVSELTDAGSYTCTFSNDGGDATSNPATVTVEDSPVTVTKVEVFNDEGETELVNFDRVTLRAEVTYSDSSVVDSSTENDVVTWSADDSVVVVDSTGKVSVFGVGKTTVTATTRDMNSDGSPMTADSSEITVLFDGGMFFRLCCLIQRKGIPAHNASFLNNILSFRHT
ncbi:immunoglobulin domain-containing protein [Vibrio harveyi]|uniref:immunoglobulin domain-containing protein n=1 Tax=Vibrio harveyi TaxID=669 RepID=UPI003D75B044